MSRRVQDNNTSVAQLVDNTSTEFFGLWRLSPTGRLKSVQYFTLGVNGERVPYTPTAPITQVKLGSTNEEIIPLIDNNGGGNKFFGEWETSATSIPDKMNYFTLDVEGDRVPYTPTLPILVDVAVGGSTITLPINQSNVRNLAFADYAALQAAMPLNANDVAYIIATGETFTYDGTNLVKRDADTNYPIEGTVDFTTAEPAAPTFGQIYINSTTGLSSVTGTAVTATSLYMWDGTNWVETNPNQGDVVYDKSNDYLLGYDGTSWISMGDGDDLVVEPLTVTATNTLSALASVPKSNAEVMIFVNGQQFDTNSGAIAVAGQTVTWNSAVAGFSILTYDVVTAQYTL